MQRVHLFEFEDYKWFPKGIRDCMTKYIVTIHKLLGSAPVLSRVIAKGLKKTNKTRIVDLCSGGTGPMPEVMQDLKETHGLKDLKLTCTDLYPNKDAAARLNNDGNPNTEYLLDPVNATQVKEQGFRTMVCSFHHMTEDVAKSILKDAHDSKEGICVFEISDNSIPYWIAWLAFPINILSVLFITPMVRPFTWQQFVFTYLIPILPLAIAWDGAVSNVRTYTVKDLQDLTSDLNDNYSWEIDTVKGKGGKKLYLLGTPN